MCILLVIANSPGVLLVTLTFLPNVNEFFQEEMLCFTLKRIDVILRDTLRCPVLKY